MKQLHLKQKDIVQLTNRSPGALGNDQVEVVDEDTGQVAGVMRFSFTPTSPKQSVADNDVNISTELTEVKLFGDGGSRGNPGPAASGWVIYDNADNLIKEGGFYVGDNNTNNQAEYLSLELGLEDAYKLGAKKVQVFMDSQLVVNQMKGLYKVKNRELLVIHQAVKSLLPRFDEVTFTHVPRERNKEADRMVNQTLDAAAK